MKKKVIISWFNILFLALLAALCILLITLLDPNDDKYIAQVIVLTVCAILYLIFINGQYFCTTLTKDTITFQHKLIGSNQQIPVRCISRFVIKVDYIKNSGRWLIVYANQQNGQILGVGNNVIISLLKTYPYIPVVLMNFRYHMSRRTAKYLVRHLKVTGSKLKELCEFYHLSPKSFDQTDVTTDEQSN
ncbi:MAG: hypothetical protein IJD47_06330 [Clostridia bacterium]|nr:hypothetical protein [Clostridia bacterium]MBQ3042797.1 hypothetical protein [Clostridia bacterium]